MAANFYKKLIFYTLLYHLFGFLDLTFTNNLLRSRLKFLADFGGGSSGGGGAGS